MHNLVVSDRADESAPRSFDYYSNSLYKNFGTMLYEWNDSYNTKANRINLGYFSYTVKDKLKGIISNEANKLLLDSSLYVCPFNESKHVSIVPVCILTDDPIHYIRLNSGINESEDKSLPWYTDMACDPTWRKDDPISAVYYELDSVSMTALGSGYTNMWWPNDGSFSISPVAMDLDNGDTIIFACLKWYNK